MGERKWEIGICGTFDVANFGDLLFPLIAESELTERLGAVSLHRFSYHAKTPPEWPYEVTSVTALPGMIDRLDGLLIGGGFLIRFDKQVAPGYVPPTPEIHHPTGYWLTPALMALQHDVPLVWNAPGTDGQNMPAWANPLMEKVLTLSRYIAVRDEPSRAVLQPLTSAPVVVVPDTAFGLPRLLNLQGPPSDEFTDLCKAARLDGPYIVVQARVGLEGFVRFIKNHAEQFRNFRFVTLPIGPALGDRQEAIDADLPGIVRLPYWPSPLVVAELIGRSEAAVGLSYHLCITALASGVPVFARFGLPACKYSALQNFETLFELPLNGEPNLEWFISRVGRKATPAAACANYNLLRNHWDRIAAELQAEAAPTAPSLDRFWQSLPALLEDSANREVEAVAQLRVEAQRLRESLTATRSETAAIQLGLDAALEQLAQAQKESAERQISFDDILRQLIVARAGTAWRDARIAEIMASISWKLTAPLRFVGRYFRKQERPELINLAYIRHHRLETHPYG
jgi:lipopolysaccharide transport system ATP-binding protein